ncbi:alpha/beta hydrolase [Embleya sp. NBC_00896]|uniref:alpha/beta hydrolase n=1 Tax=Embleya sp. NBC_00896 TaxID=2975961 RepID=UPI00386ACA08|nr:esterase family protein [Embleya sp. NBC_00896]
MNPLSARRRRTAALFGAALVVVAAAACGSSGDSSADKSASTVGPTGADGRPVTAPVKPPPPAKVLMPTGPTTSFTTARTTPAGPILMTSYTGPKSGVTAKVWVWLPPEYHDPAYAKHGFPVLTLYAGGQSNGYNTWTDDQLPIQEIATQEVKAGRTHPFIMVMPVQNLEKAESRSLECSDIPGQPKMGTWMSQDIPDLVKANFRTLRSPEGWGLMGGSTGAFCSVKLALQHPEQFRAAVPIDGYFNPDSPLWKGHEAERLANSPDQLIGAGTARIDVLATAGGANLTEVRLVKAFVAKAAPPVRIEYYEQPGGRHLTAHFKRMIPDMLGWLGKHLSPPTAD